MRDGCQVKIVHLSEPFLGASHFNKDTFVHRDRPYHIWMGKILALLLEDQQMFVQDFLSRTGV